MRQDFKGGSPLWVERQVEPWKCYVSAVGKQTQEVKQQLEDTQAVLAAAQKQPARAPAPATSEQIAQAAGAAFSTAFAAALMQTAQR